MHDSLWTRLGWLDNPSIFYFFTAQTRVATTLSVYLTQTQVQGVHRGSEECHKLQFTF